MAPEHPTYEALRDAIPRIDKALDPNERTLVWIGDERLLALARAADDRVEVFLVGEPLVPSLKVVSAVLEHDVWCTDDGSQLAANRIVLPHGEHFDQFAALMCVELLDNGLTDDPQVAFSSVEPLVALALTRDMATDLTILGLIGELVLLDHLLAEVPPGSAPDIVRSWAGSTPSARDFQLGSVGIEVKTTQGSESVHHVEGVHQVELGHPNDGAIEVALFMLSLGISWVTGGDHGRSLPDLVEAILDRLPDPDDRSDLVARVKQYGGDAASGYDHQRDRNKQRYSIRFYVKFERLYDMGDERLELLTSKQLAGLKNIDPASVSFRVVLPDRVRGVHNPVSGWEALVAAIFDKAGTLKHGSAKAT